jgi:hypothetical protein
VHRLVRSPWFWALLLLALLVILIAVSEGPAIFRINQMYHLF